MLVYLILCYDVLFYVVSFYFIVFYCILFILGYLWLLPKEGSRREPPRWQRHTLIWFDLISVEIIYLRFLPGEGPRWPPSSVTRACFHFSITKHFICLLFILFKCECAQGKAQATSWATEICFDFIWFDFSLI